MAKTTKALREHVKGSENPYEGRVGLVYPRVSSKKQETQGHGRESQESRCVKDLVAIGVPFEKTFPDTFTGGGDFMNRPAMRELLAYIDKRPHKKFVVVFDDLKRFARDTIFHLKLRSAFKGRDVVLRCLNYNFDDSPEGMFVETVLAAGNELERHQNARQVVQKMRARLEAGYWPFARKRGYDMVNDPIHGKLAMPNADADLIRVALENFSTGQLRQQIDVAKHLVDLNFWGKGKNPEKYLTRTKAMLQDPFYCGDVEHLDWEVERRPGKHQGLILRETYQRIQVRLNRPIATVRERLDISPDFPLRGLLLCSHCGRHLTAAWAKQRTYAHYFCQNKECPLDNKTTRKKDVEDAFIALLKRNTIKADAEKVLLLAYERVWKQEIKSLEQREGRLAQQRKETRQKIAELTEVARKAQSDVVRGAYEREIEIAAKELEASDMPNDSADFSVPYRTALTKVVGMFKSPYTVWQSVGVHEQRHLFFFLFEKKLAYSKTEGYRTGDSLSTTRLFEELAATDSSSVDPAIKTLNSLKTYLSRFWDYYQSSPSLQKALENA